MTFQTDIAAAENCQSLDRIGMRTRAKIATIDWTQMSETEGQRLRALGLDTGVAVEKLHKGMFGFNDPIALKVGRMMIAVRRAHAAAISVTLTA